MGYEFKDRHPQSHIPTIEFDFYCYLPNPRKERLIVQEDIFEHQALISADISQAKDKETLLRNHILIDRDDVIITPHNAFNSRESRLRVVKATFENIRTFIAGQPQNVIDFS